MIFTDRKGRTWARRLDVDGAIRMRDYADFDVMKLASDTEFRRHIASPDRSAVVAVIDALYAHFLPDMGGINYKRWIKLTRGIHHSEFQLMLFEAVDKFFAMPYIAASGGDGGQRVITPEILWGDIYRLAGEAAVSPGNLTFGEIAALADSARKLQWAQTATIRADIRNYSFGSKMPTNPADLDPTGGLRASSRRELEITPETMDIFQMFCR